MVLLQRNMKLRKQPPLSLSLVTFISITIFTTATTIISPGTTLYASNTNQSWPSPNNTFSLRFYPLQTTPSSFIAAVVHSGGAPIIWSAGNSAAVDFGGYLRLLPAGNLRLVNGSGATLWDSNTSNIGVTSATVLESGNFVLSNGTSTVWSSFENPTDTIVPSQSFNLGMVLRSGVYSFFLQKSGNLTLSWNNSVTYWDQGLNFSMSGVNLSSPVLGLKSEGILEISDPNLTSPVVVAYSSDYNEGGNNVLRVLKLGDDGNLRVYSYLKGSEVVNVNWVAVEDQCEVFGYCGNYGVCSYDSKSEPLCGCPSHNFEMVDPNDGRKGCQRKVKLEDCVGKLVVEIVLLLVLVLLPLPWRMEPDGVTLRRRISSVDTRILRCLALPSLRNIPRFGGFSAHYALLEYASGAPIHFSYKELQRSTKGFKEKLGDGGFGAVYKGTLANKSVVAVKQLEGIEQGDKQFRMEVSTISSTHHLNLVRLIGFCSEGRHRLLVYEFMKNGSLDNFLFVDDELQSGKLLDWDQRFNIALGAARGLTYLHEECRNCIVHCDIKPENILLDENYNAKVSDFGLAKLSSATNHRHRTLTSVRGTRGYLAPEWLANLPITSKSDVYSYGMVVLEIVSGRRNFEVSEETNRKKCSIWAYEEFEKGNIRGVIDKRLFCEEVKLEKVERLIMACFWCIQEQPSMRPTMSKVVQMLEGVVDIENPPPPKSITMGFSSAINTNVADSSAL
nr:G-type lectin S-receptor-like serine/threonine-protein kinase At1g34300 isoform X3 [Arachis hypogaea]